MRTKRSSTSCRSLTGMFLAFTMYAYFEFSDHCDQWEVLPEWWQRLVLLQNYLLHKVLGQYIRQIKFCDYETDWIFQRSAPNVHIHDKLREYWIKRFKSYGELKFYNLARQIEEISNVINQMPKSSPSAKSIEIDDENLSKVLKNYDNEPFVCKTSDMLIISKKLLELLECDVD